MFYYTDRNIESRPMLLKSIGVYVPRDERFGQVKMADVLAFGIKSLLHFVKPGIKSLIKGEFENFDEIMEMYECGDTLFKFPKPQVIESK